MLKLGFKQSKFDQCFFYRKGLMAVCYVDNQGITGATPELIQEYIQELKDEGFSLTQEESFSEFLGIQIEPHPSKPNALEMTQKGLIKKVIEATKMENCSPNRVPALPEALGKCPDEAPHD